LRLLIASDLHLEFEPLEVPNSGVDLAIYAGDLANGTDGLDWAIAQGLPAIYVPGNHEYYHQRVLQFRAALKARAAGSQVRVLDNDVAEISVAGRTLRVIGSTLWTDFDLYEGGRDKAMKVATKLMYDFRHVELAPGRILDPETTREWHARACRFLEIELAKPFAGTTLVVTHHAPSERSNPPRHHGSPLTPAFCSHRDALVARSGAALWVHGHTHQDVDYHIGETRVVSSQRGYPGEAPDWSPMIVEL
jgi:predicted phosphodiesterase